MYSLFKKTIIMLYIEYFESIEDFSFSQSIQNRHMGFIETLIAN